MENMFVKSRGPAHSRSPGGSGTGWQHTHGGGDDSRHVSELCCPAADQHHGAVVTTDAVSCALSGSRCPSAAALASSLMRSAAVQDLDGGRICTTTTQKQPCKLRTHSSSCSGGAKAVPWAAGSSAHRTPSATGSLFTFSPPSRNFFPILSEKNALVVEICSLRREWQLKQGPTTHIYLLWEEGPL